MGIKEIACLLFVVACASASDYNNCPTLFGFYPDSYDCTRFYRCSFGKSFQFTCAPGTRWSQHLLTCDYAAKVPCGGYPAAPEAYHPIPAYPDHSGHFVEPYVHVAHAAPMNNGYYDFVNNYRHNFPAYHKK